MLAEIEKSGNLSMILAIEGNKPFKKARLNCIYVFF